MRWLILCRFVARQFFVFATMCIDYATLWASMTRRSITMSFNVVSTKFLIKLKLKITTLLIGYWTVDIKRAKKLKEMLTVSRNGYRIKERVIITNKIHYTANIWHAANFNGTEENAVQLVGRICSWNLQLPDDHLVGPGLDPSWVA